jgi:D-serine deaminase-like pyridoxal phosphate-dependent protein
MADALPGADSIRQIDVCVELGAAGGRTGARSLGAAWETATALHASPALRLAGVAGYEGALAHTAATESLAVVRSYLDTLRALHDQLRAAGLFKDADSTGDTLVTAGGSAFFDVVADALSPVTRDGSRLVLRSGAYLIHDDGFYRRISPFSRLPRAHALRSAMHGWSRVVSHPEPALALLDGGKRDFPFDEGLPTPQRVVSREVSTPQGCWISALNDQHAFLRCPPEARMDLSAGDVLRLGLSHPCTAFDKWGMIPVIDDADHRDPRVVDLVRTFF